MNPRTSEQGRNHCHVAQVSISCRWNDHTHTRIAKSPYQDATADATRRPHRFMNFPPYKRTQQMHQAGCVRLCFAQGSGVIEWSASASTRWLQALRADPRRKVMAHALAPKALPVGTKDVRNMGFANYNRFPSVGESPCGLASRGSCQDAQRTSK